MRKILLVVLVLGLLATGSVAMADEAPAAETPRTIVDTPHVRVRVPDGITVVKRLRCVGGSELDGVKWIVPGFNRAFEGLTIRASQWVRHISPGVERNGARFVIRNNTGFPMTVKLTALCSDVINGVPQPRGIVDTPSRRVQSLNGSSDAYRMRCDEGSELDGAKYIVPGWHRSYPGLVMTMQQWVGAQGGANNAGPRFTIRNTTGFNLPVVITGLCADVTS
jgi:hypothetical protein